MSLSELLVSGATMLRRTVCRAAGLSVAARMASRTQGAGAAAAFVSGGDVAARAAHTLRSDRKPTRAELLEAIHNSQLAMDKTYTTDVRSGGKRGAGRDSVAAPARPGARGHQP